MKNLSDFALPYSVKNLVCLALKWVPLFLLGVQAFSAPAPTPTVTYTPSVAIIQGNQPLVAGSAVQAGTNPRTLQITCPNFGAVVTFPLTVSLGVRIPANVGANPGVPLGASDAIVLSYLSLSASTVTFTAPNTVAEVIVSVNVPAPVISGNYYWNIYVTNWPISPVVDPGATVNANVLPSVISPTVKPVIIDLLPPNGKRYESNGVAPILIPISYTATCVQTDLGGSAITTLQANFDSRPLTLTRNETNLSNPDGSFVGYAAVDVSTVDAGPHTISVSAVNAAGTATASTQINIYAPPRITNTDNPSFAYGKSGNFQVTCTGFELPGFTATGLPSWASIDPVTGLISVTSPVVGSYPFVVTATNSLGSDTHNFTLVVTPAQLTVTAVAVTKVYGTPEPGSLSYSVSPAPFGTDVLTGALTRAPGENAGTYAIGLGTVSAGPNYVISYVGANFVITPKPLTVNAVSATKVYGNPDPASLGYTLVGTLVGSDVLSGSLLRAAGENVGTYAIGRGSLTAGPNYSVAFVPANFSITPRTLSFTCTAASKVYDGTTTASVVVTPAGVQGADVISISGTASFSDKNVGAAKSVAVSGITLSGAAAGNYLLPATSATATANITKANLTVTAENKSMVSGGTLPALTALIQGFVAGETLATSGVTGSASLTTTATATSAAGSYPITAAVGSLSAANYAFSFVPGVLTVTAPATQPTCGTAIVRRGPKINGNAGVDGSVQVLLPDDIELNGNAFVSESLLVIGSPTVRSDGRAMVGVQVDGSGSSSPSGYRVSLNGNAVVGRLVRRTDAIAMPAVTAPVASTNSRDVRLNESTSSAGDFSTIRDLSISGSTSTISLPAGTYRDVAVSGRSSLRIGVAGATTPAIYNLRNLSISSNCTLDVVGPVILRVSADVAVGGTVGNSAHAEWLGMNLSSGNLTLNGDALLFGSVVAPNGEVKIDGQGKLQGGLACDRLTLNGWGLVDLCGGKGGASGGSNNHDDDDDDDDSDHSEGHDS